MIYRHGDLLIQKVIKIPQNVAKVKGNTLVEGEATGHKHSLSGQVQIYANQDQKFFEVEQKTILSHQEHKPLEIPPGKYKVVQEREWNPFDEQIRRVMD